MPSAASFAENAVVAPISLARSGQGIHLGGGSPRDGLDGIHGALEVGEPLPRGNQPGSHGPHGGANAHHPGRDLIPDARHDLQVAGLHWHGYSAASRFAVRAASRASIAGLRLRRLPGPDALKDHGRQFSLRPVPDVGLVLLFLGRVAQLVVVEPPPDGLIGLPVPAVAEQAQHEGAVIPNLGNRLCDRVPQFLHQDQHQVVEFRDRGGAIQRSVERLQFVLGGELLDPLVVVQDTGGLIGPDARVEQRPEGVEPVRPLLPLLHPGPCGAPQGSRRLRRVRLPLRLSAHP